MDPDFELSNSIELIGRHLMRFQIALDTLKGDITSVQMVIEELKLNLKERKIEKGVKDEFSGIDKSKC